MAIAPEVLERKYWVENKSTVKIAKELGVTHRTILNYMDRYSIPRRTLKEAKLLQFPRPRKQILENLYLKQRKSLSSIAKLFNVSIDCVHGWLRRYGIQLRGYRGCHVEFENEEYRKQHAARIAKLSRSKERRQRSSETFKKLNKDPTFQRKRWEGIGAKPTRPERELEALLNQICPGQWSYTGAGDLIIAGKCPDFANINGKKELIELFGTYWHDPFDIARRTEHYRKFGYSTLVIWEDELKNTDRVSRKILKFTGRKVKK